MFFDRGSYDSRMVGGAGVRSVVSEWGLPVRLMRKSRLELGISRG